MKTRKFVVEIERYGRRSRRLVPARDKYAALRNCTEEGTVILSCEPYAGQRIEKDYMSAIICECMSTNRRRHGA